MSCPSEIITSPQVNRIISQGQIGPQGPAGATGPQGPPGPPGSGTGATPLLLDDIAPLGAVLAYNDVGAAVLIDNADPDSWDYAGVALEAGLTGEIVDVATHAGVAAAALFAIPPASGDNGSRVFAGVGGMATLSAPTSPGAAVIEIGKLIGANGVTLTPVVALRWRFILVRS